MAAIMGLSLWKTFLIKGYIIPFSQFGFVVLGSLEVHCCFRAALAHVQPVLLSTFKSAFWIKNLIVYAINLNLVQPDK
jgi:hypothetical protein